MMLDNIEEVQQIPTSQLKTMLREMDGYEKKAKNVQHETNLYKLKLSLDKKYNNPTIYQVADLVKMEVGIRVYRNLK